MEFEEFLVSRVDEGLGPQVRVCLHDSSPFSVALKMNHMVCDAAGFKPYLQFLCKIYSGLMANPAYKPAEITGDRSMRGVLKRFCMGAKLKCLILQSNSCRCDRAHALGRHGGPLSLADLGVGRSGGRGPGRPELVPVESPFRTRHFAVIRKTRIMRRARLCKAAAPK